ncbi:MAG TPA: Zn-ribbon domain-containing OB-fold protein [Dehalococcoidia bacterium]|nr:Zn-ribbon domain-containing OB-fold protein [Dehalococcoidia bacterium]
MTTQAPQGAGAPERRVPPRPMPFPENPALTAPFWEAAKRHELVMQRCKNCTNYIHFPREQCPVCFSQDLEWTQVSGKGRVYAFTNVYQAQHPAFQDGTPYTFAIVQLDEGPRMVTNVVGCKPEDVQCDMRVEATYDDASDEWTLVKFQPAK